jgi:hypothetical protein
MPIKTTLGQLLVNEALPEKYRDYGRVMDSKAVSAVMDKVANEDPDSYRDILKNLFDVGRDVSYRTGGFSFGIDDLRTAVSAKQMRMELESKIRQIRTDKTLDDKTRSNRIIETVLSYQQPMEDAILAESKAEQNPLAFQIMSGSRGKPANLKGIRGGDLLYTDHKDRAIPIPVVHSFSEGLTPAEYFAGSFGARKGVVDTKLAVQNSGYMSKQLLQIAHRLLITAKDAEDEASLVDRGLPVDVDDSDNVGALLAMPVGNYPRNTMLTPKILKDISANGATKILVRSPVATGSPDGGLYARDVGVRERGGLPANGDFVGLAASAAIAEPISQSTLCLAEGTLVRMADWSVKRIEDIVPGDMVIGSDLEGNLSVTTVKAVYNNGIRACHRSEFTVSMTKERVELVSTLDHKILAKAVRWHPTNIINDYGIHPLSEKCVRLCGLMPRSVNHDGGTKHEPMALLLGLLLGDGCYTKSVHGVHLSCFDPLLIEHITPMLSEMGLKAVLRAGQKGYYRISQIKDTISQDPVTGRTLPGDRNPALIKIKELNMYGKYAYEKVLPEDVWSWNRESLLNLLAGLIATDGSVYTAVQRKAQKAAYMSYASTSLEMVRQVRELISVRLGIRPSLVYTNKTGRKRNLYSISITRQADVAALAAILADYVPGVKRDRLKDVASGYITKKDTRFFYRKQQTSVGDLPTYDIEVDNDTHLFLLANGLIVSNSSKHSGGVAGGKSISGFKVLNQLIQSPKHSPFWATHAQADGKIEDIRPNPAGGQFIRVKGIEHYVSPDATIKLKPGEEIEAGDMLTDGIPNPAEFVRHKGIGEGRRQFVTAFRTALQDAGIGANRRNIEILSRGIVNHVRLNDSLGEFMPDEVVPYDALERTWTPRDGASKFNLEASRGKYLEKPVLHYTIGTRVTPNVLKDLKQFGIKDVLAHDEPAPFEPHFVRGLDNLQHDQDWMTKMLGSSLQKSTLNSVWTGAVAYEKGTSYVPSLAKSIGFGTQGPVKGFNPKEIIKPDAINNGVL